MSFHNARWLPEWRPCFIAMAMLASLATGTIAVAHRQAPEKHGTTAGRTVPLTACGVLNAPGATYVLETDVSAPNTCFGIQADGITLDLNGHTVTYGTAGGTIRHHGVVAASCSDPAIVGTDNPCGGSFRNLTIRNGAIIESANLNVPYSFAIKVGQGSGRNLTVHNVNITVHSVSTAAIAATFAGGGMQVFNNTIDNRVKEIINRHAIEGISIRTAGEQGTDAPDLIYNNVIHGGAQGGILVTAPGSKVYGNEIHLDSRYANGFCIYAWAPRGEYFDNVCDNTVNNGAGRGIQVDLGDGIVVRDNTIRVIEQPRVVEYGGCQPVGAYGIQIESKATNADIFDNRVTALADQCDGIGLRVTVAGGLDKGGNRVHNNVFTAQRVGASTKRAIGASMIGVLGNAVDIYDNTFVADSVGVHVDSVGMRGVVFRNNRFRVGSNPFEWLLVQFQSEQYDSNDNAFLDSVFENGAEKERSTLRRRFPGSTLQEFYIRWTLTVQVTDRSGNPIANAEVEVSDAKKDVVFTGTTDAKGTVSAVLNESRRFNSPTGASKEMFTPHRLAITKAGCTPNPDTSTLVMNQARTVERQLTCR